ncbi:putative leader peptide [Nakamurella sp. UYEF19]
METHAVNALDLQPTALRSLLGACRRHVDLQRVSSALCC